MVIKFFSTLSLAVMLLAGTSAMASGNEWERHDISLLDSLLAVMDVESAGYVCDDIVVISKFPDIDLVAMNCVNGESFVIYESKEVTDVYRRVSSITHEQ